MEKVLKAFVWETETSLSLKKGDEGGSKDMENFVFSNLPWPFFSRRGKIEKPEEP
jgi:hypothetical protein